MCRVEELRLLSQIEQVMAIPAIGDLLNFKFVAKGVSSMSYTC